MRIRRQGAGVQHLYAGEDWNDLKAMARDAVLCHFDEDNVPRVIRLHLVREEAIAV